MSTDASPPEPRKRVYIPLWVALAGMVLAFILALIIMAAVLEPLTNLVFPTKPVPPLPPDAVLLEAIAAPSTSNGEWLYGSQLEGCAVAQFYIEQRGTCQFNPFSCERGEDGNLRPHSLSEGLSAIGTCTATFSNVANSYSWEVIIARGSAEHTSRFRVYLYKERQ